MTPGDEVGSVGGGNEKHRKQRPRGGSRLARESKRPMKLVLERVEDGDLVKCQFTNSGEQINFNFSLRVDKPEALASNLVSLSKDGNLQLILRTLCFNIVVMV